MFCIKGKKMKISRNKSKVSTIALVLILAMTVSLIASPLVTAQVELIMNLPGPEGQPHPVLTGTGTDIRLDGGPGPGYDIELWVKSPGDTEFQYIWTGTTTTAGWWWGALDYYDFDFAVEGSYFLYWAYPGNVSISNIEEAVASDPIPLDLPTFILVSVAPNPVGVGQTMFVNAS